MPAMDGCVQLGAIVPASDGLFQVRSVHLWSIAYLLSP